MKIISSIYCTIEGKTVKGEDDGKGIYSFHFDRLPASGFMQFNQK